jgi:hypothetical protein
MYLTLPDAWKHGSLNINLNNEVAIWNLSLFAGYLLGLFFDPEDGGDMSPERQGFLRITWRYNPEDHALY